MNKRKPVILFVDDEQYIRDEFSKLLQLRGYEVLAMADPDKAIECIENREVIDLLLADIQLYAGESRRMSNIQSAGGQLAGLEIARFYRRNFQHSPVLFWSSSYNRDLRPALREIGNSYLVSKRMDTTYVLDLIADALEGFSSGKRPRVFIIHGHDEESLKELLSVLTKTFAFPPPIILREQDSGLATLVERIEAEAGKIDVVFALLTPDDQVILKDESRIQYQPRQNVLFELGFFLGLHGRGVGCLILLYKEPVQLPSDLGGLVPINITKGVQSQTALITKELGEWVRRA